MTPQLQIDRINKCNDWLDKTSKQGEELQMQNISWYITNINILCNSLAFVNTQMAVSRKILNEKKVNAYNSLMASSVANQMYFAPSLAKDYIASKCAQEQFDYDLCERTSRSISHIIDGYRSCLSALKTEMQTISYQQ